MWTPYDDQPNESCNKTYHPNSDEYSAQKKRNRNKAITVSFFLMTPEKVMQVLLPEW